MDKGDAAADAKGAKKQTCSPLASIEVHGSFAPILSRGSQDSQSRVRTRVVGISCLLSPFATAGPRTEAPLRQGGASLRFCFSFAFHYHKRIGTNTRSALQRTHHAQEPSLCCSLLPISPPQAAHAAGVHLQQDRTNRQQAGHLQHQRISVAQSRQGRAGQSQPSRQGSRTWGWSFQGSRFSGPPRCSSVSAGRVPLRKRAQQAPSQHRLGPSTLCYAALEWQPRSSSASAADAPSRSCRKANGDQWADAHEDAEPDEG